MVDNKPNNFNKEIKDFILEVDEDDFELEGERGDSTFLTHVIAGSFAGLMEHILIYPIDTIKVKQLIKIRLICKQVQLIYHQWKHYLHYIIKEDLVDFGRVLLYWVVHVFRHMLYIFQFMK